MFIRTTLVALALSLTLQAAQTVHGHIACEREGWLRDTIRFGQENNQEALKSYLKMERCYVIQGGVPVQIRKETEDGLTRFFVQGSTLWVVSDGIKR
jgi:hypothetical protein